MGAPTRVLVADDQTLVRSGIRLILEAHSDLEVVSEASDGIEAIQLTREQHPDVVLMDIQMLRATPTGSPPSPASVPHPAIRRTSSC